MSHDKEAVKRQINKSIQESLIRNIENILVSRSNSSEQLNLIKTKFPNLYDKVKQFIKAMILSRTRSGYDILEKRYGTTNIIEIQNSLFSHEEADKLSLRLSILKPTNNDDDMRNQILKYAERTDVDLVGLHHIILELPKIKQRKSSDIDRFNCSTRVKHLLNQYLHDTRVYKNKKGETVYETDSSEVKFYDNREVNILIAKNAVSVGCTYCIHLKKIVCEQAEYINATGCQELVSLTMTNVKRCVLENCNGIKKIISNNLIALTCNHSSSLEVIEAPNLDNLTCDYCYNIVTLNLPNARNLECNNCVKLETIYAPSAEYITCIHCKNLKSLVAPNLKRIRSSVDLSNFNIPPNVRRM